MRAIFKPGRRAHQRYALNLIRHRPHVRFHNGERDVSFLRLMHFGIALVVLV